MLTRGQFGGDPDHVVIHGASAGAGSVALHMMAYGGRDDHLFVGGVAESLFFPAQPYLHELEWQFDRITQQVGCNGTQDAMGCLRSKDIETLQNVNAVQPFPNRTAPPFPLFYWTPCIDGDFLKDLPYKLLESGKFIDVPVIFGDDTDEGSSFAMDANTQEDFSDFMRDNYPLLSDSDVAQILAEYPELPALAGRGTWFPTLSQAYGEATFTCPAINFLTMLTSHNGSSTTNGNGQKAWSYRYDVQDYDQLAQGLGVQHLSEAPAIFGPNNTQGALGSYYTYNAPIVPVMMDYWISFIMSLDPNTYRNGAAPRWEPWLSTSGVNAGAGTGAGGSRIVVRTGNLTMENVPPDQMARCQLWKGLAQTMEQKKRR
jgi:acetylcholinesterase